MNPNLRIGVFDSGVGGLELLLQLRRLLPDERVYYFADTVNNPYGEKSSETIACYLEEIIDGLLLRRVKLLVIACNTASAVFEALPKDHRIRRKLAISGVDVIPITASGIVSELASLAPKRVLVAATRLTVEFAIYERMIAAALENTKVLSIAAPEWVDCVERPLKDPQAEHARRRDAVSQRLSLLGKFKPDAFVLGCTHFPRLMEHIKPLLPKDCKIVNPALSLAYFVKNYLSLRSMLAKDGKDDKALLFTNGRASDIENRLEGFGLPDIPAVRQVDIRQDLSGKAVDVIGYGKTGKSLIAHLLGRDVSRLTLRDRNPDITDKLKKDFPGYDISAIGGKDYLEGIDTSDTIFRSPGVPGDLLQLRLAKAAGIPVLTDIDIFLREAPGRKVAISGTNGKTTTTILCHRLLSRRWGKSARIIGNVGRPVLDDLPLLDSDSACAIELSSFQLEELETLPVDVSILLNITPDHLDRHGDMAGYISAKGRILTLLEESSLAIYNIDSEPIVNELLPQGCRATLLPISRNRRLSRGAWLDGNDLVFKLDGEDELRIESYRLEARFCGTHNFENVMAAGLAALALGVDRFAVIDVLRSFCGVRHRIEHFYKSGDVDYYDDSKGTNPDATIKAIAAMDRPLHLIAGGVNKGCDFDGVAQACSTKVRAAYLFGEIVDEFSQSLSRFADSVSVEICGNLTEATEAAKRTAKQGEAVLFSPASASEAGLKYYQRGLQFQKLVASSSVDERQNPGLYLPDPLAEAE